MEEGRPSAYEPFPDEPYLAALFDILESDEKIIWIEKSRDLMVSWACVAYLILKAMTTAECGVLFQTQKEAKAAQLVNYAKCLYRRQEPPVCGCAPRHYSYRGRLGPRRPGHGHRSIEPPETNRCTRERVVAVCGEGVLRLRPSTAAPAFTG